MANEKEEYLYLNPDTQRWGPTLSRGAEFRLKRTIVYSYSEYNYNRVERRVMESWEPMIEDAYKALTPLQRGHQWTYSTVQQPDGSVMIEVTMARVADEYCETVTRFPKKFIMQTNYTFSVTPERWSKIVARVSEVPFDLICLDVDMVAMERLYTRTLAARDALMAAYARAIELVKTLTSDQLLELEQLIESVRPAHHRYLSDRSHMHAVAIAVQREPARLPEKARLAAWTADCAQESPLPALIALSQSAVQAHAVTLRNGSPHEQQAALIVELLNAFYGSLLAWADGDTIVLNDPNGKPAAVIAPGQLRPFVRS